MPYKYQKNKKYILNYQKNSDHYKEYKRKYDIEYRKKNSLYANFRSTKSRLYKMYCSEIAKTKLTIYLLKQKTKGHNIEIFLDKLDYNA